MKQILTVALTASIAAMSLNAAEAGPRRTNTKPNQGINKLKGETKKQKGVIFINGKRLTACVDWGKDKGWCKEHNK